MLSKIIKVFLMLLVCQASWCQNHTFFESYTLKGGISWSVEFGAILPGMFVSIGVATRNEFGGEFGAFFCLITAGFGFSMGVYKTYQFLKPQIRLSWFNRFGLFLRNYLNYFSFTPSLSLIIDTFELSLGWPILIDRENIRVRRWDGLESREVPFTSWPFSYSLKLLWITDEHQF